MIARTTWITYRVALLAAAGLCCWARSSRSFAQPANGDAIVVGSIGDASRLLPILATDSASGDIVGLLFNGLLKYNERLEIVGDLAESWTVSDDGLTLTFVLRPSARWHDGLPVTAADVRFTYEKLVDPGVH